MESTAQLLVSKVVMLLATILMISNHGAIDVRGASAARHERLLGFSSSSSEEGVVRYWEEKLHGAVMSMPPMLRAMVTPLKENEADFLITKIRSSTLHQNGHTSYLPSNAPSFCKRTSIVCDRKGYASVDACRHYPEASLESDDQLERGGFFREKQTLVKGARIEINHPQMVDDGGDEVESRAFLPRGLMQLFPFTKEGLPQMATMLGISNEAVPSMENTIADCYSKGVPGEIKSCLTSIEAMADFVASTMGSDKPLALLDVSHHMPASVGKRQTVMDVKTLKGDPNDNYLACHDMLFPFRVFYCHYIQQTKIFVATLQASDGSLHDRVAVCHYDTSQWNPKHVSFFDLGTKPGESEACHWMLKTGFVFLHQ